MNLTNTLADDISAVTTNFVHICRSIGSQSEETFSQKHENIQPSIKEKVNIFFFFLSIKRLKLKELTLF